MKKHFETDRLILRPWTEDDAEELYKYAKDPLVGPRAGWTVHTSVENSKEIIKNILSAKGTFAVVLKETNLPIGSIGIMQNKNIPTKEDEVEIGYWIGRPYWGMGLIPEACKELIRYCFETLNCSKIWCGYYSRNINSRRVQEKCGFEYHHTEYEKCCELLNEYRTEHVTVLTKEHWQELQQQKLLDECNPKEKLIHELKWKVSFEGGFWTVDGWGSEKIFINKSFQYNNEICYIPYLYDCPEGLVIDYCIGVKPELIKEFYDKWDLVKYYNSDLNHEEQMMLQNENPLNFDFYANEIKVNDLSLKCTHGCSMTYIPEECQNQISYSMDLDKILIKQYELDEKMGWKIYRASYLYDKMHPETFDNLELHLVSEMKDYAGIHILNPKENDCVKFTHPVSGCEHELTVLKCESQKLGEKHFPDDEMEYPKHYQTMTYKLTPDISPDKFSISDCKQGDSPRIKGESKSMTCSVAVVGISRINKEDGCHSVCSSLHFEPVDSVEWKITFREKIAEDATVRILWISE